LTGTVVVVVSNPGQKRQHPQSERSSTTTTTRGDEFAGVIAPLEAATGVPLFNPQRQWCLGQFLSHPDAVRELAHQVLQEPGLRNPLGIFVWRLTKGWHLPLDVASGGVAERIDASLRSS
jgi:hypothetical protein